MASQNTALVMLGVQGDHFSENAPLRQAVDPSSRIDDVLESMVQLAQSLQQQGAVVIHVPVQFSSDYTEITQTTGVLAEIKEHRLFQEGTAGSQAMAVLDSMGDALLTLHGRTGFNAFRATVLDEELQSRQIRRILLAGATTAVCIDSTARAGYELGYEIEILQDCIVSRTQTEHDLYCEAVFPQYAIVSTASRVLGNEE